MEELLNAGKITVSYETLLEIGIRYEIPKI